MPKRGAWRVRQEQKIVHLQALCEMMDAITEDVRFTEQIENLLDKEWKGEGIRMCEYLNMLEAKGQKRGEKIGKNRLARLISSLAREKKY